MASSHLRILRSHYPWTSAPLITSAPMRLIATSPLAVAVIRAGGLGFLGAGTNLSSFSALLDEAITALQSYPISNTPPGTLPIGVGFICCITSCVQRVLDECTLYPQFLWYSLTLRRRSLKERFSEVKSMLLAWLPEAEATTCWEPTSQPQSPLSNPRR
jgi:hypothetical protein